MIHDYAVSVGSSKGGKGIKAAYDTRMVRTPEELIPLFQEIIKNYKSTALRPEILDVFPDNWKHSINAKQAREISVAKHLQDLKDEKA